MAGRNPTLREKKLLKERGLNYKNWLITKVVFEELHIKHRHTDRVKIMPLRRTS